MRAFVRARETGLVVLAAIAGALAGLVVAAMSSAVDLLHSLFFDLPLGQRLSALPLLDPVLAVVVPTLGGLVLAIAYHFIARWRPAREVDPIEANALHGGRMSLLGSLIVALETVWSSGVGASVGMEAGYTQLSSGIGSRIGRAFRLRRADLRMLVGCGAAGGIAGAFGAPLAGAFYGFELVIGNYSVANLAPVGIAALLGYYVAGSLAPVKLGIVAPQITTVTNQDLLFAALVGLAMALFGIVVMVGVNFFETVLERIRLPALLRPSLGGAIVGGLATVTPAGDVVGPRRAAPDRNARPAAYSDRHSSRSQGARLDRVAGIGLPRRAVLRLAADGRAGRTAVRDRDELDRSPHLRRHQCLCHRRDERAVGVGDRRPADHDLRRPGIDRQSVARRQPC